MILLHIILMLSVLMFAVAFNNRFPRKQTILILVLVVFALAGIGASIVPKDNYDLARHYQVIERVRKSSYTLGSFLSKGYTITSSNYRYTYLFNVLIYIVARWFPNQALPFIAIFITYILFVSVLLREFEDSDLNNKNILLSFSIFLVLLPFLYVYSGIRNALASTIVGYGLYRFFKNKKFFIFAFCSICAVLIHPVAIAVIPFIVLSKYSPSVIGLIITLVIPSLLNPVIEFVRLHVHNDFLFGIAAKYYNYTMVRVDNQGRVFLYSPIIVLVIIIINVVWNQKKKRMPDADNKYSLANLFVWYSAFSLGYFKNYSMITRLPYSIAVLSPVIVNEVLSYHCVKSELKQIVRIVTIGSILFIAALGLYENIMWLV